MRYEIPEDTLPREHPARVLFELVGTLDVSGFTSATKAVEGQAGRPVLFIAGAGVAGLAAIGTSVGLGAIVRANDTRAEVADQVKSMGAEFVKVDYEEEGSGGGGYAKVMSEGFQKAQREMYAKQAKDVDIIITTALIPGKPAPRLITAEMVKSMHPGSVIVDMAAEQGGNCELTEPGKAVVKHGVTIIGYTDLASRLAKQSSTLYANNLLRLTEELCKAKDGQIVVNMDDDAIRGFTVIKDGAIMATSGLAGNQRVALMYWAMQEKFDGRRVLVRKAGAEIHGINRKGLLIGLPSPIVVGAHKIGSDFILDGECIGDVLYAFDLLEWDGEDYRRTRHAKIFVADGEPSGAGSPAQGGNADEAGLNRLVDQLLQTAEKGQPQEIRRIPKLHR